MAKAKKSKKKEVESSLKPGETRKFRTELSFNFEARYDSEGDGGKTRQYRVSLLDKDDRPLMYLPVNVASGVVEALEGKDLEAEVLRHASDEIVQGLCNQAEVGFLIESLAGDDTTKGQIIGSLRELKRQDVDGKALGTTLVLLATNE